MYFCFFCWHSYICTFAFFVGSDATFVVIPHVRICQDIFQQMYLSYFYENGIILGYNSCDDLCFLLLY